MARTLTLDERVRPSPVLTAGEDPQGDCTGEQSKQPVSMFYLFMAALSLVAERRGYSPAVVHEPLIAEASPVMEHRFLGIQTSVVVARGLRSSGSQAPKAQAQWLWCMG